MKISIITLHRAENYGSVLQAYALQKKIEDLGHEAEILDYHPERYTNGGKLKRLKDKSGMFRCPLLLLLAKILIYPSYIRKNRVFESFIKKYLHLSSVFLRRMKKQNNCNLMRTSTARGLIRCGIAIGMKE